MRINNKKSTSSETEAHTNNQQFSILALLTGAGVGGVLLSKIYQHFIGLAGQLNLPNNLAEMTDKTDMTIKRSQQIIATSPFMNGTEFRVNTYLSTSQLFPSIAVLTSGDFVVAWQSENQDGSQYGIYAQRYNSAAAAVGGEFQVNTYTTDHQIKPSVTALSDGGFVVTWESFWQDGGEYGIYGQRYDGATITVDSEFKINTYTTGNQQAHSVASLSDGGFLVVWESLVQEASGVGIYGQRYDNAGVAVGTELHINTYTTGNQSQPFISHLTNGDFLIVWMGGGSMGSSEIYAQQYDNTGAPINSEFRVNTFTTNNQEFPAAAALINGGFVVTWVSTIQDGDGYGIYGQCFDAVGSPVASEFQVNTFTTNDQVDPSVTGLTNGGFVISWTSNVGVDDPFYGVYSQHFDDRGNPQDDETRVNINITNLQSDPFVASLTDGAYIVAFMSRFPDGDDIYAKIFTPVTSPSPAPAPPPFPWFNNPFIIFTAIGFGAFALLAATALAYAKYQSKKSNGQIKVDAEMEQVHNPALRQNDDPLIVVSPHSIKTPKDEEGRAPSGSVVSTLPESYLIPYSQLALGKTLGKGAYGIVYEGTWENSKVAIKQLLATTLSDVALKDFLQEAEIMSNLHHDNVIRLNGVSIDEPGHLSMVMELMPQGSLFDFLQSGQPLSWDVRYSIANDIIAGLGYLHHRDILHRDLKSLNVLIGYGMRAKLTDFGMAKIKSQTRSTKTLAEGNAKGTIAWMAPEQFKRGFEASKSSDIYSYGMVLWELVTRKIPFDDASSVEVLTSWVKDAEQEKIPEDCPQQLAKLIKWCWEKEPSARPTATQVTGELKSDESLQAKTADTMPNYHENLNTQFG